MQYHSLCSRIALVCALGLVCLSALAAPDVLSSRLNLFPRDENLNSPNESRSYWFVVPAGAAFVERPALTLAYQFSATLMPEQASLTVLLNNTPVASREMARENAETPLEWPVALPIELLKPGFNELRIASQHRSHDGLCRDIDNPANWVRLGRDSHIDFLRQVPTAYPLAWYPYPYLDTLATPAVQSDLVLPPAFTASHVEALLNTASDWGYHDPTRGLPVRVKFGEQGGNFVHKLIFDPSAQLMATMGHSKADPQTGWLRASQHDETGGLWLRVSGNDADGMKKASRALALPKTVEQFDGTDALISHMVDPLATLPTVRLGTFTLRDMQYEPIALTGVFHQVQSITLLRPTRCRLGKESTFTVHFRHAAILDPHRSNLTVYINGTPAGSASLSPENAVNGELTAHIPIKELLKPIWKVDFAVMHDIGIVDCGKRYDEVAWTVIEDTTAFTLITGKLDCQPYLDHFPSLQTNLPGVPQPTTMWLSAHPSASQLSLAAAIAVRAGQVNRAPVQWHVVMGDDLNPGTLGDACVIALGYHKESARFAPYAHALLAAPEQDGHFTTTVPGVVADALPVRTLLQAVPAPFNTHSALYAVLAPDDAAYDRLAGLLADPVEADRVYGDFCSVSALRIPVGVTSRSDEDTARMIHDEEVRYTLPMTLIMTLIVLGCLLALGAFIRLFFRPRKPAATAAP